jgi:general secretion pathway protein I
VNLRGFTLLEVMVSIAILAIALTALLGSQSQSMMAADEADFAVNSAFLARKKLVELLAEDDNLIDSSGDFGDSHPTYLWRVEVEDADFSEVELLQETQGLLKRYDLIVYTRDERRLYSVTRYVLAGAGR